MTPDKFYMSWAQLDSDLRYIVREMATNNYKPELIIGPGRGGYIPGVMLSHYFNVPFEGFNWQTRDGKIEDSTTLRTILSKYPDSNICLIDDINDTGKTLLGIDDLVQQHKSVVTYVTLFDKLSSEFGKVKYTAHEVAPEEERWIVFPYEEWWT